MILDTSAIIAIIMKEQEAGALAKAISTSNTVAIASPTAVEAGIVLGNHLGFNTATAVLKNFFQVMEAEIIPFTQMHWQYALKAYDKFGKGRHPAALNFGDCFSYAAAKLAKQPLLFKGNDFNRTDIVVADY